MQFQIVLSLYVLIEKQIMHALVGILLWIKQIKPKYSKIKYAETKNENCYYCYYYYCYCYRCCYYIVLNEI